MILHSEAGVGDSSARRRSRRRQEPVEAAGFRPSPGDPGGLPGPSRRLLPLALLLGLIAAPAARAVTLAGRVYDGPASAAAFQTRSEADDWLQPLRGASVSISLVTDAGVVSSWNVTTEGDGAFRIDDGAGTPAGARFVARVDRDGQQQFSPSFAPSTHARVFVYPTSDDASRVTATLRVAHDLTDAAGESEALHRVRYRVTLSNVSSTLYVGSRVGDRREILRLPVPDGARISSNTGPVAGVGFRLTDDGRWAIIDEPVGGFPDLATYLRDAPAATGMFRDWEMGFAWNLELEFEPRQDSAFHYQFPLSVGVAFFSQKGRVHLVGPDLGTPSESASDPFHGGASPFELTSLAGRTPRLDAKQRLLVGVKIDSASIGQVSHYALRWHAGFVLLGLVAVGLGLLLGPRRIDAAALFEGLSEDELIDRVCVLDERFKAGQIPDREYRPYREALVELIAADQARSKSRPQAEAAAVTAAIPAPVADLLRKIRALDASPDRTPEGAAERVRLVEALLGELDRGAIR